MYLTLYNFNEQYSTVARIYRQSVTIINIDTNEHAYVSAARGSFVEK